MRADARLFQALLREDFNAFVEKAFVTLAPGQDFVPAWYLHAIAYELERIRRGENRRLIINLPPRSLKSIMASVAFPAFLLGHDPTQRIICVSYSGELARKHSNDFRALVEALWFRTLFPGTRIGRKDTEGEIETTARGFRLATSVGGTLTGRGAQVLVIDDPLKPEDAMSEARRSAANEWFNNTLMSRLDDKRTGAIVIVMQRLHVDDLAGFVMSSSDSWTVLSLPAIAEFDEDIPLSAGRIHHRQIGDVLAPEREPLFVLEEMRKQLGSAAFSAQYQQTPAPPEGSMIKRHWIRRYDQLPPEHEQLTVLQSWDTASKGGPENDFSVCTTWIFTRDQQCYLTDVFRRRLDYPGLKAAAIRLARQHGAYRVLIEDAASGTALAQELKSEIGGVVAVKPEHDKRSRMSVVSARFEAGQVHLPNRAPWLAEFEAELFSFPEARHDDQCDSVSQALMDQALKRRLTITPEMLERSRQRLRFSPHIAARRAEMRDPTTPPNTLW